MSQENKSEDVFQNLKDGFSEFGKKVGTLMDEVFSGEGAEGEFKIRADVYQTKDQYVIELELPSVKKEEVSIQVHEGELIVKGEKKAVEGASGFTYYRQERSYGSFFRSFALPLNAELDNIKAKYEAGVLTIRFPRVPFPEEGTSNIDIE